MRLLLLVLAAQILEGGEIFAGAVPGALDGIQVAGDGEERFAGIGFDDALEFAEFLDYRGFNAAGALETPPILGDFLDEHGFLFGSGGVVSDELEAELVVGGGVLAFGDDLFTGEAVFGGVVAGGLETGGSAWSSAMASVGAVRVELQRGSHWGSFGGEGRPPDYIGTDGVKCFGCKLMRN